MTQFIHCKQKVIFGEWHTLKATAQEQDKGYARIILHIGRCASPDCTVQEILGFEGVGRFGGIVQQLTKIPPRKHRQYLSRLQQHRPGQSMTVQGSLHQWPFSFRSKIPVR